MIRYDRLVRLVAIALAAQAGFVDALGFVSLGGYFVSFMSGNSTRAAVELTRNLEAAVIALSLVALFVVGVMTGAVVRRGRIKPITTVQSCVVGYLCLAAVAHLLTYDLIAAAIMTIAMGAENAAFEREGEVSIGVTYMTGALVKMGQLLVGSIFGGNRTAWIWQALLWLGFVAGGVIGAIVYGVIALNGLWLAVLGGILLAFACSRIERAPVRR